MLEIFVQFIVEIIMSNWNIGLADRVLTSSWDDVGVVPAERSKVKVGYPCAPNCENAPVVKHILGSVESITCIMSWNGHKKLPDTRFQQQTLTGRLYLEYVQLSASI